MRLLLLALLALPVVAADWNPRAAADYLDARQKQWVAWPAANNSSGGKCVSCHTGMTYLLARPALRRVLGESQPTEYETGLLESLRSRVSKRYPKELYPKATEPHLSEEAAVESIFAAWFIGSADAFDRMWSLQTPAGSWAWNNFDLDPWETPASAYYGAALAALALRSGPAAHRDRPEAARLKQYLESGFDSQPLHNRVMAIWAGAVPDPARKSAILQLWKAQSSDGAWTLDALGPWAKHEKAAPSAGSSAYATAFVAAALRKAGVSRTEPGLARALAWLKSHQDPNGYWDAISMNKVFPPDSMMSGFMRDAATSYAVLALAEDR
jgi:squalene-hopene/tetraprenyl-beta-curcumene cyclase